MALVVVNWRPGRTALRGFGLICLAALAGLGAWALFGRSLLCFDLAPATAWTVALWLWAGAGLCGLLAVALPRALYPLYLALLAVSYPIGLVVSHLALALLYFGLFAPVALLFRLLGRDALGRRFERGRRSYWVEREVVTDRTRYFRQY